MQDNVRLDGPRSALFSCDHGMIAPMSYGCLVRTASFLPPLAKSHSQMNVAVLRRAEKVKIFSVVQFVKMT